MSNFLKRFDTFGSVVGLHFGNWLHKEEGRSPVFKTSIGGIFTIFNQSIFWVSFIFYAKILFLRDNNSITFQTLTEDWDDLARKQSVKPSFAEL